MRIAVIGTGIAGRTLAGALSGAGHDVVVGTRDVDAALGLNDVAAWAGEQPAVRLLALGDVAREADVVVNATNGNGSVAALQAVGDLDGVVVADVSNPLDFSGGFPPTLFVKDTDSLGEQVQRAFPDARVVKSLNTMTASLMVDPGQLGETTTVFVSGEDADAKAIVTALLADLGHRDVVDLGGIETARGVEMYLPLWLRTMGALGTGVFNIKVVR